VHAAAPGCVLEIRPLIAFRDYHGTTHRNNTLNATVESKPGLATVAPYPDLPALYFAHDASTCFRRAIGTTTLNTTWNASEPRFSGRSLQPLRSEVRHERAHACHDHRIHRAAGRSPAPGLRQSEIDRRQASPDGRDPLVRDLIVRRRSVHRQAR